MSKGTMEEAIRMQMALQLTSTYADNVLGRLNSDEFMLENIGMTISDALTDVVDVLNAVRSAAGVQLTNEAIRDVEQGIDTFTYLSLAFGMARDLLTTEQREQLSKDLRVAIQMALLARRMKLPPIPLGSPKTREHLNLMWAGIVTIIENGLKPADGKTPQQHAEEIVAGLKAKAKEEGQ